MKRPILNTSIISLLFAGNIGLLIGAANEAPLTEETSNEIAIANLDGGGDAMFQADLNGLFIPYGEYPHKKGLQKFTKASAEAMAGAWNSLGEKVRRVFTGVPIYVGHPDVPELRQFYPDTKAYGWAEGITAENEGMRIPVKWTAAGKEMVENGHYKFYSPYWLLEKVAGGLSPKRLKSIGLTNNNNIPVPALANEAAAASALPGWLTEALGLDGSASEDDAKKALGGKLEQASKAQDLADTHAKLEKKHKEVSDAHAKLDKAYADHNTAMAAVKAMAANERSARITLEIAPLITSARVLAAEKDALVASLAAANEEDFCGKIAELTKRAPQLKTKPITDNLGNAKPDLHAANEATLRSEKRREAVAGEMKLIDAANNGLDASKKYELAWRRAEAKNPDLFTAESAK
jgi:Mu-like prophage I protein